MAKKIILSVVVVVLVLVAAVFLFNRLEQSGRLGTEASVKSQIRPYSRYGLSYNAETDELCYEGTLVRQLFDDEKNRLVTTRLGADSWPAGTIDLFAVYENGKLTGLRVATESEYSEATEQRRQFASSALPEE